MMKHFNLTTYLTELSNLYAQITNAGNDLFLVRPVKPSFNNTYAIFQLPIMERAKSDLHENALIPTEEDLEQISKCVGKDGAANNLRNQAYYLSKFSRPDYDHSFGLIALGQVISEGFAVLKHDYPDVH